MNAEYYDGLAVYILNHGTVGAGKAFSFKFDENIERNMRHELIQRLKTDIAFRSACEAARSRSSWEYNTNREKRK